MQEIQSIGEVSWGRQDIQNALPEFVRLLKNKPIADNEGGMKAPHLFATWFLIKQLQPKVVIESGVWKGLGTWLIEQASPQAQIICIDPVWDWIEYKSDKAHYLKEDFAHINWDTWNLPKDQTVLFFDDHQNAFKRILTAQQFGFQHLIFEDNYPALRGDCYSLKKAFMHAGFQAQKPKAFGRWERWKHWLFPPKVEKILPNRQDADYLAQNCKIYYEFPPIFKSDKTRWGDIWEQTNYPTPLPILETIANEEEQIFQAEAIFYTWLCYVKLK